MKAFHRDRVSGRTSTSAGTSDIVILTLWTRDLLYFTRNWQLPLGGKKIKNKKYTQHKTPRVGLNSSQFTAAELNPPTRPMSPLLDLAHPDVGLQGLGPRLPNDPSLPQRGEPAVCTCHGEKGSETAFGRTSAHRGAGAFNPRQCSAPGPTPMYCLPFQ